MTLNRRGFLKQALLTVTALPFLKGAMSALAPITAEAQEKKSKKPSKKEAAKTEAAPAKDVPLPAGATAASETDPVAMAVGYKANVKDIDYTKYPQRKKPEAKDQFCKNCVFYTAQNEGWGKCQIIPNGSVAAAGWCGSYQKKA